MMRYSVAIKKSLSLFVGILLLYLFFRLGGFSSFKKIKELNLLFALFSFACTFGVIYVVTLRWRKILQVLTAKADIKRNDLFQYFLVSKLLGTVIPKDISDFTVRGISVNRSGKANVTNAFQSVLIDRIFDVFILMALIIPAVLFFLFYPSLNNSLLLYLLSAVLFLGVLKVNPLKLLEGLLSRVLKKFTTGMFKNFNYDVFTKLIFFSLIKFFASVFFLFFLAKALDVRIPLEVLFWGSSIGQLFFLISITPGALGILEIGWFGILMIAGVAEPDIIYFVTMRRICSIAFMALLLAISSSSNIFLKIYRFSTGLGRAKHG